jgi:hypothetical protein
MARTAFETNRDSTFMKHMATYDIVYVFMVCRSALL